MPSHKKSYGASSYLAAVEQGQLTVCKYNIIASGVTDRG